MKKKRLVGNVGKLIIILFVIFIYFVLLFNVCKYNIISNYYLIFTIVNVLFLFTILLLYFIKKKKVNYFSILIFILMCITTFISFYFSKHNIKNCYDFKFQNNSFYVENQSFPQNEIIIKKQRLLFFSKNIGKIIIPKNCNYEILDSSSNIKIKIDYNDKTIYYIIDMENEKIQYIDSECKK